LPGANANFFDARLHALGVRDAIAYLARLAILPGACLLTQRGYAH
jgi:hypothetical protein